MHMRKFGRLIVPPSVALEAFDPLMFAGDKHVRLIRLSEHDEMQYEVIQYDEGSG